MSSLVQIKNNSPTIKKDYNTNPINSLRATIVNQNRKDFYLNNIFSKIPYMNH